MINSTIRGKAHYQTPFHVGFPLDSGRFVHVLDEMTVDLLLDELDTVPDLVNYLGCKEAFISTPGRVLYLQRLALGQPQGVAGLFDRRRLLPTLDALASATPRPDTLQASSRRVERRVATTYNGEQWIESLEGQLPILRPHLVCRVLTK
jgi:hypothetical protein